MDASAGKALASSLGHVCPALGSRKQASLWAVPTSLDYSASSRPVGEPRGSSALAACGCTGSSSRCPVFWACQGKSCANSVWNGQSD